MMVSYLNWYNYLLFQFFHSTRSICIYHPTSKAQSTVSLYPVRTLCSPLGLPASVSLVSYVQGLPTRESATWPPVVTVSSAGRQNRSYWRSEPLRVQQERLGSAQVCTAAVPPSPLISHAQVPPQARAQGYLLVDSNHLPNLEGHSSDGQHVLL